MHCVVANTHRFDPVAFEQANRKSPRSIGLNPNLTRRVRHRITQGRDRTRCGKAPVDHGDNGVSDPLDFAQHMRRNDDGATFLSESAEEADEVGPLDGISSVERLVKEEDARIVYPERRPLWLSDASPLRTSRAAGWLRQ